MLNCDVNVNRYLDQQLRTLAVKADTIIYRGALVGLDRVSGYVRPLQAGDMFVGLAYEQCDNSSGSNGDREVILFTQGDFEFSLSGADKTDIGKPIFASDDNTLTLSGGNASYIGKIIDVPASGQMIVRIDPQNRFIHTLTVPLFVEESSIDNASEAQRKKHASADLLCPVAVFSQPVMITAAFVWFEKKPSVGYIDVGFGDNNDPDEIIDYFNLATLTNSEPAKMPIVNPIVPAGKRICARISRIGRNRGLGGGLSLEYVVL